MNAAAAFSAEDKVSSAPSFLGVADTLFCKLFNRVLSDYPVAGERLSRHVGKSLDLAVGPMQGPIRARLRVTAEGRFEPRGQSGAGGERGEVNEAAGALVMRIPLPALRALATKDPEAYSRIQFEGDSEFAQTLSIISRNVEWDIEHDLSRALGGGHAAEIIAHRLVGAATGLAVWKDEASQRLLENLAEYLTHERDAFVTSAELESFRLDNENLRDAVARLEARVKLLGG